MYEVYSLLADYRDPGAHPAILPRPSFVDLQVEQGRVGDGTVISFRMKVAGRLQSFRAAITEPEPGRVLTDRLLGPTYVKELQQLAQVLEKRRAR